MSIEDYSKSSRWSYIKSGKGVLHENRLSDRVGQVAGGVIKMCNDERMHNGRYRKSTKVSYTGGENNATLTDKI